MLGFSAIAQTALADLPFLSAPPPPFANFTTCIGLAEMHRQAAYLAARIAFPAGDGSLQRAILAADQQYFLEVLGCALQFNMTVPNAVEGLAETVDRLAKPFP